MEVITIQSDAWKELNEKIETIKEKVETSKRKEWEKEWIDNETFLKRLNISRKTGQTYRDLGLISFSQVGNKIYFRNKDVEEFLLHHHIHRRGGDV